MSNLETENIIKYHVDRRTEDDQFAIIGSTVYQCPDGYSLYIKDSASPERAEIYETFGIYFGPSTIDGLGARRFHIHIACLSEK